MALDPNRWTLKTQEAVNLALAAARSASNPEVTPDHLLLALLGRVQALDETYFYGGCHRLWGAYYTQRGQYDRAAASFERAAEIAPAFLVTRRMYAVLYATRRRDRRLFVEQLTLVVREREPADADILPEFRLEQNLARRLLAQADRLFPK